jgi:hypothetical protein
MESLPPAAVSPSPVDNLLEAVAEAQEAERIAARWDEKARQNAKFTYESHDGENFLNRMSLALTVHDAPMWRVRVRVSSHKRHIICLLIH